MAQRTVQDASPQTHQVVPAILQWSTELDGLVRFMRAQRIRSFLEIGSATGLLTFYLRSTLRLEKVAACDLYYSPFLRAAEDIPFFWGDHHDAAYETWRDRLGHVDMVFIDADHEQGFRRDYEIERQFPCRFFAFHDIANKAYPELRLFWQTEVHGNKVEFVNTDRSLRFGVPPLRFPFLIWPTFQDYIAMHGYACGIGVTTSES